MTCTCGHAEDEHEDGSSLGTPCTVSVDGEDCPCLMFEADEEDDGEE